MTEEWASKLTPLVIGRYILLHVGLSQGCLSPHLGCQLLLEWVIQKGERAQDKDTKFYNFISEVRDHHIFCILLVTQTNPSTLWEGIYEDWKPGGKDPWGPSWKLAIRLPLKYRILLSPETGKLFPQFRVETISADPAIAVARNSLSTHVNFYTKNSSFTYKWFLNFRLFFFIFVFLSISFLHTSTYLFLPTSTPYPRHPGELTHHSFR